MYKRKLLSEFRIIEIILKIKVEKRTVQVVTFETKGPWATLLISTIVLVSIYFTMFIKNKTFKSLKNSFIFRDLTIY